MAAARVPIGQVGRVTEAPRLTIRAAGGDRDVIAASIRDLAAAWRGALPFGNETSEGPAAGGRAGGRGGEAAR